jgi:hypothetical protein
MRKPIAITAPLVVALATSLAPSTARAQDAAGAEVLFQQAHQLFEEKRYAEACPKFAESYRLDKVSGALLALASCHEVEGKLASAWSELVEVGTLARREGKNDRADAASQRAATLEPKLGKLTIALAQGAESVEGLLVKRDGVVVGQASFGAALPVDRGAHVIEATAPGRLPFKTRVTTLDGASELVPIPFLSAAEGAVPTTPAEQPAETAPPTPTPAANASPFPVRTVGIVTGAIGVVVVGVGGYFGFQAISKNSDSNKTGCSGDVCTGAGKQARLDAVSAGNTATALVVVGGVLAAGGLVMFLVGGPSSADADTKPAVAAAPVLGSDRAGVALTGRF